MISQGWWDMSVIPAFWGQRDRGIEIRSRREGYTATTYLKKVNDHQQQEEIGLLSTLSWIL